MNWVRFLIPKDSNHQQSFSFLEKSQGTKRWVY